MGINDIIENFDYITPIGKMSFITTDNNFSNESKYE